MTAPVGYDPHRIRSLVGLTGAAIEGLGRIRSADADAADAVHAARVTRHNLEDLWMPLLAEIEASAAMVEWRRSQLAALRTEWSGAAAWLGAGPHGDLDDGELLAELARLDDTVPLVHDDASNDEYGRWLAGRRALAAELARRVATDDAFAAALVDASYHTPTIGLLVGLAAFPAPFRADLLAATLDHPWWEEGWEMDKYAGSADTLIASLLDDPERCLDVLGRGEAARTLAGWHPLDQDLVAAFVTSAMADGGPFTGARLRERYEVLREFVLLANDAPFDGGGFQPGVATGLASSIGTYLPTFAGSLENEHSTVQARSYGPDGDYDFTLGWREEVVDFFGAMTRAPAAQAELGVTLDLAVRDSLGDTPSLRVGDVAEFAELLDLAVGNEEDELGIAAAARQTSLLRLGATLTFAIAVGTAAARVGSARRTATERTGDFVTREVAGAVRADTIGRSALRAVAYQSIQLEACRRFAATAHERPRRSIESRIGELEALIANPDADPADRHRSMLNLLQDVRDAGGGEFLDDILEENSVDDLDEADHDTDL